MSNLSKPLRGSLKKENKADPFAVADLDSLADEMLTQLAEPSLNRGALVEIAKKIKAAAESTTLFLIEAGLAE